MNKHFYLLALGLTLVGTPLFAAHYTIDPAHSSVSFKVKHMSISKVDGKFEKFSGDFNYDEKNPAAWSTSASIDANSINTSSEGRDKHLKSADFFDTAKFPALNFKSAGVTNAANGKAVLSGILNMHGVEKPISLDLEFGGTAQDPMGNSRAGFEANGKVNRKDFGINPGSPNAMIGEDIEIRISIEGILDKAPGNKAMDKKPEMKKEEKKK